MQNIQDPIYSQVGGLRQVGDESATLDVGTRSVFTSAVLTAARTLSLPSALLAGAGVSIIVRDVAQAVSATNTLTVDLAGTDTYNSGIVNPILTGPGQVCSLTSDGVSKWTGSVTSGAATSLAAAKYTANATAGATTAAAGDLTGAAYVNALYSAVGAANLTTRTAALMIADAGLVVGQTYMLNIANSNAGTTTLVGGTGVTITGTATIAQNTTRQFMVKVTAAATMTFQSVGTGTFS